MKKILVTLAGVISLCTGAFAFQPVPLYETAKGDRYFLVDAVIEEGRIKSTVQCELSAPSRQRVSVLMKKQDVPPAAASSVRYNEFCLYFSPDGKHYQRLYDSYLNAREEVILDLKVNPEGWFETPANSEQAPAKALLESGRVLNVPVFLPVPEKTPENKSNRGNTPQSVADWRPVKVEDLVAKYKADPAQFKDDYEYAVIRVSGILVKTGAEKDMRTLLIKPEKNGAPGTILCYMEEDEYIASKKKRRIGGKITIEGSYRKMRISEGDLALECCSVM